VVTQPLSCMQTVKVNTENSDEYVPQERQPSQANKNNGCEHAESLEKTRLAGLHDGCCTASQICDGGSRSELPLKQ
jgi:hypothetical protein